MKVLITGPQGSGKTTQSEFLAKYLNLPLIDVGQMLRVLAQEDSEDGRKIKEKLDQGLMAPNGIVSERIRERVEGIGSRDGFIVDGYPRVLDQLKIYDPDYNLVIYLDISDGVAVERLVKRGREDDKPELVKKRLSLYHLLTEPVLAYYLQKGILRKINGERSKEEIGEDIKRLFNG